MATCTELTTECNHSLNNDNEQHNNNNINNNAYSNNVYNNCSDIETEMNGFRNTGDGKLTREMLKEKLEWLLSRETILADPHLASMMSKDLNITMKSLLSHSLVKLWDVTAEDIEAAVSTSTYIDRVDIEGDTDDPIALHPKIDMRQTIIMMRQLPSEYSIDQIYELLLQSPLDNIKDKILSVYKEVNDTWFVELKDSEIAQKLAQWLQSQEMNEKMIEVRLKANHFLGYLLGTSAGQPLFTSMNRHVLPTKLHYHNWRDQIDGRHIESRCKDGTTYGEKRYPQQKVGGSKVYDGIGGKRHDRRVSQKNVQHMNEQSDSTADAKYNKQSTHARRAFNNKKGSSNNRNGNGTGHQNGWISSKEGRPSQSPSDNRRNENVVQTPVKPKLDDTLYEFPSLAAAANVRIPKHKGYKNSLKNYNMEELVKLHSKIDEADTTIQTQESGISISTEEVLFGVSNEVESVWNIKHKLNAQVC